MGKLRTVLVLALLSALIVIIVPIGVKAQYTLIWEADVSSHCSPLVTSPMPLELGREYLIEAKGVFTDSEVGGYYDFAADAQYYSPNTLHVHPWPDWWIWTSHFPAPDNHSFLQINGMDVNWGPFSNGGPDYAGHEYAISYMGLGAPITFQIVDWIDNDCTLNFCTIHVKIYEGPLVAFGETAFAYGGEYATCFLCMDFDEDGKGDFKNWGWSNGPLGLNYYEFDIYAGAAKCDLTKGTLVGTLTVDYDGSTATVTYMMNEDWTMGFAQLYVGSEPLPRKDDEYTTSPGQYPLIVYVEGPTHTFTVSGLSGDIYVVAHADVFPV